MENGFGEVALKVNLKPYYVLGMRTDFVKMEYCLLNADNVGGIDRLGPSRTGPGSSLQIDGPGSHLVLGQARKMAVSGGPVRNRADTMVRNDPFEMQSEG